MVKKNKRKTQNRGGEALTRHNKNLRDLKNSLERSNEDYMGELDIRINIPLRPHTLTLGKKRSRLPGEKGFEYDLAIFEKNLDKFSNILKPIAFFEHTTMEKWSQEKYLYEVFRWLIIAHQAMGNPQMSNDPDGAIIWNPYNGTTTHVELQPDIESERANSIRIHLQNKTFRETLQNHDSLIRILEPNIMRGSFLFYQPRIYLFQIWTQRRKKAREMAKFLKEAGLVPEILRVHFITLADAKNLRFEKNDHGEWSLKPLL